MLANSPMAGMSNALRGFENYGFEAGKLVDPSHIPHFLEISEDFPENAVPILDQEDIALSYLTDDQMHWRDHGYVIKRNFVPHDLIDEYVEIRKKENLGYGVFPNNTPYLNHSAIRDICCSRDLHYLLVDLLGEELGLHFLLTGFKSTMRGWHQDDYLNPEDTMARYAAVWIAMGDIDPASGPFEFVPGSHKWPCLRREKVRALVAPDSRDVTDEWTLIAEYFVNKAVENYISETGCEIAKFEAKKGDILIWHGKLIHRGSVPNDSNLTRPALICHYSNIRDRRDIGNNIVRHGDGGYFWEFPGAGRVLTDDKFERSVTPAGKYSLVGQHEGNLRWLNTRTWDFDSQPRAQKQTPRRRIRSDGAVSAATVQQQANRHRLETRVAELESELRSMRSSTSWRVTAPGRTLSRWLLGRR